MDQGQNSTNLYIVIAIFAITFIIIIIYAILIVFMRIGEWGLFAPFEPIAPASPDKVFRPLGTPEPLTSDEIAERQEFAQAFISIVNGATPS